VTDRRSVRVSAAFFEQLDKQLGADRGPKGEPSATDFIVLELPGIVERFALGFAELPEVVPGLPSARMLIAPGLLVDCFVVYGVLAVDQAVDLIGVTFDP
jgi:hypothetical protein